MLNKRYVYRLAKIAVLKADVKQKKKWSGVNSFLFC